jgi:nucleoside-diphosphate-sugar epimerase
MNRRLLILGATGSVGRHVLQEALAAGDDVTVVPLFASLVPQMIVPYADAAALMLANLDRGNAMSRRRVGLALPVGMRGPKAQ